MDNNSPDSLDNSPINSSLEGVPEVVEHDTLSNGPGDKPPTPPQTPGSRRRNLIARMNIYMQLFIVIMVIGGGVVIWAYLDSKHTSTTANLASKNLSAATLAQLANTDSTVGGTGQLLNIQSSAVFAGKVLVRQDLDVAGNLQIGGTLSLNDLAVSGTSQFGQAQVNKDLAVAGTTSLQGAVTVAKNLQVGGGGTFSGPVSAPQVTTSTLQLNGDLVLTHHITAGGPTPGRSNGSALGSGGTSSVSGSDTAGSIVVNTGGSPAAGCFLTINFSAKYASTPHVIVTPIGSNAGSLNYYVNRSTSDFSVCDATSPPSGSSFGFDYFVVD